MAPTAGPSSSHGKRALQKPPPRPPNSFILYRSAKCAELKAGRAERGEPPLQMADVSKLISRMWAEETPEVVLEYERQAESAAARHAAANPGYKYRP
ncbi:hypothetical protein BD414DRAFT_423547, partial [Trametes punicea]